METHLIIIIIIIIFILILSVKASFFKLFIH